MVGSLMGTPSIDYLILNLDFTTYICSALDKLFKFPMSQFCFVFSLENEVKIIFNSEGQGEN